MVRRPSPGAHEVREEVLNVLLAELLEERGLLSVPESIRRLARGKGHRLPDVVLADLWGARIIIEGRILDNERDRDTLLVDARRRVEEGLSPICLAVLYPPELRSGPSLPAIKRALARSSFEVRVISESDDGAWTESDVQGVVEVVHRGYELLVRDDVVAQAVEDLQGALAAATEIMVAGTGNVNRLADLLGIPEETRPPGRRQPVDNAADEDEDEDNDDGARLVPRDAQRVGRTASLTIVNAMIFQQVLADHDARIPPLARLLERRNLAEDLAAAWRAILEIDYIPIFKLAREIVVELRGTPDIDRALAELARAAERITARRAALRHDLMGRIFHRLLTDAKFFGAYYTTIPAATLLLKLTLDPSVGPDWAKVGELRQLRIGDLACGTGTLLKAALHVVVDNHVRAAAQGGVTPDLRAVHSALVEDVLWGLDVVPFAIHLAAAALALHAPDVQFTKMNLATLPLSGPPATRLGSIELFHARHVSIQADLFGGTAAPTRTSGAGDVVDTLDVPRLDVCVMNPPFVRSVGGNLLFGNLPKPTRNAMQRDLRRLVADNHVRASITAGLGPVFTALGDRLLKPHGELALVLPRAMLSGVAWTETRELLARRYHVRVIVVSHEPHGWNFSENTKLSECLIVARRREHKVTPGPTKVVNLWRRPRNSIEALDVARQITNRAGASLTAAAGTDDLHLGEEKIAEVVSVDARQIAEGRFGEAAAFAQTELCRVALRLRGGQLLVPGQGVVGSIPMTALRTLAQLGPDVRDIADGFRPSASPTAYAAFRGHTSADTTTMSQQPNGYLAALARAKPGRNLRDADLLWGRAGRVLLAERLRLTTAHVVAVHLPRKVLSNTWWPVSFNGETTEEQRAREKIFTVWMNSTLGIISLASIRVDTEGPWIKLKKPIFDDMLVPDPGRLTQRQREAILEIYAALHDTELRRLPELAADEARAELDRRLARALGLRTDLRTVRETLAREPILHG